MSYPFDVDPQSLFDLRTAQWTRTGLPLADINRMRGAIRDMWTSGEHGWVPQWCRLAEEYAAAGQHLLAAMAYGAAKFPSLVDEQRHEALRRQVNQYSLAAVGFPVRFTRHVVGLPYDMSTVEVPVHVLSAPDAGTDAPVLLASGGVDTWKMDQHPILTAMALGLGGHVVAFDHPGTGELAGIPMSAHAESLVAGLAPFARSLTTGRVGHLGISFGGHFSARTGLRGEVDAAIVLGGPVSHAFADEHIARLPAGMPDILGNALGFAAPPGPDQLLAQLRTLDLRPLLAVGHNAPMLVVNGDADPMVLIERMQAQHDAITDHVEAAGTLLNRWRAGGDTGTALQLAGELDQLSGVLATHLAEEEDRILPLAAQHLTVSEWNELAEHGLASMGRAQLLMTLGAILEDATNDERAVFLAKIPLLGRVAWTVFGRQRYQRAMRRQRCGKG